jgi:hypothetical protein
MGAAYLAPPIECIAKYCQHGEKSPFAHAGIEMKPSTLRWSFLSVLVVLTALSRAYQPMPNFTAVGALAIVSAIMAPRAAYSFLFTWAGMLLGDLFLAQTNSTVGFSPDYFSYLGFGIVTALSLTIRSNPKIWKVAILGVTGSLVFFLFSNGAVWVQSAIKHGSYSPDGSGLLDCYIAGIPFYRAMVLGDLLYLPLFCGGMVGVKVLEGRSAAKLARENG